MIEIKPTSKRAAAYATGPDFCRIFAEDMDNLYLLSLLLTADPEKAEQCFVSGFGDCSGASRVFKEWARSWARRAVIQNAIRLIAPAPNDESSAADSGRLRNEAGAEARPVLRQEIAAVLELQPFDRFVFVTSVLERYSDQECALLLGCTRQNVIAARTRALQRLAESAESDRRKTETLHDKPKPLIGLPMPIGLATSA